MKFPVLYQISARDWLTRLAGSSGGIGTLDAIPDADLDRLSEFGFDWLYLLGVWQTGPEGARISRRNEAWHAGYTRALSDFDMAAVSGSPFAVQSYTVHSDFGGDAALRRLRDRLQQRGIRLMLDFVPNHVAIDHPWTTTNPHRLIQGSQQDLDREPGNFIAYAGRIFAYGRDPYFPGWTDTVQLDYSNAETRTAMASEMTKIAAQCDGLRCDMAMLLLPQIFQRTWGRHVPLFWPDAIQNARRLHPNFVMLAEVYWDLGWDLQQQGFDYTYDKTLYDRLLGQDASTVRSHLTADLAFQNRLARFLENHDEPRIAEELPFDRHRVAALIAFGTPGLRFLHDGQLEGAIRKPSIHLSRREREPANPEIAAFYRWLTPRLRTTFSGEWQLLNVRSAWDGNDTHHSFVASAWFRDNALRTLIVVNFSPHPSQGYVDLANGLGVADSLTLLDALTGNSYPRDTSDLLDRGLYINLPPWGAHVFEM